MSEKKNEDVVLKKLRLTDDELTTIVRSLEYRMERLNKMLSDPDETIGEDNIHQMKMALKKVFLLHSKLSEARRAIITH